MNRSVTVILHLVKLKNRRNVRTEGMSKMKIKYGKALSLGLVLSFASQLSIAAALKDTPTKSVSDRQSSLIEKALDQQNAIL